MVTMIIIYTIIIPIITVIIRMLLKSGHCYDYIKKYSTHGIIERLK